MFFQVCGKPVTTNTGKCLRPPDNSRVILYLKDINLPRYIDTYMYVCTYMYVYGI